MNVYDFDDTIYDGESSLHLFFFYLKKKPTLLRYMPKVLKAFIRYKKGLVSIDEMLNEYAPMIESMIDEVVGPNDAKEFWDKHMKNIKHFYKEIQQEDDLIITASPEFTIKEVCDRLGIKNFLCTTYNESTGKIDIICLKQNKVKAFFENYPDCEIENFYTDSPKNDKPLIDIAKHAFIVDGQKITQVK